MVEQSEGRAKADVNMQFVQGFCVAMLNQWGLPPVTILAGETFDVTYFPPGATSIDMPMSNYRGYWWGTHSADPWVSYTHQCTSFGRSHIHAHCGPTQLEMLRGGIA